MFTNIKFAAIKWFWSTDYSLPMPKPSGPALFFIFFPPFFLKWVETSKHSIEGKEGRKTERGWAELGFSMWIEQAHGDYSLAMFCWGRFFTWLLKVRMNQKKTEHRTNNKIQMQMKIIKFFSIQSCCKNWVLEEVKYVHSSIFQVRVKCPRLFFSVTTV